MLKFHWIYKYQPRNYLNTVYCVTAVSNKRETISLDIEYLFSSFGYSEQISWILRDRHTRKRRKRMKILNFRQGIVSLMKLYFIICLWEKKRMKEGRDFCLDHSNFKRFEANKRNVLDDSTLLRQFCLVFVSFFSKTDSWHIHFVWKLPQMSHLNFLIMAFSNNFGPVW